MTVNYVPLTQNSNFADDSKLLDGFVFDAGRLSAPIPPGTIINSRIKTGSE